MMMEGLSVADAIALQDRNDEGFMGGNGMWIFFLFFLLAWGGNGLGFGGNGNAANQITNDFLFNNIDRKLDQGFGQIANQNFSTQKDILQGFNSVGNGLCTLGYQTQQGISTIQAELANCCCTTNRNIDSVRYENAKNTCDIVTNANMNTRDIIASQTASTQRIVDMFTQDKIESLRDQLQSANLTLANATQTENIVAHLRNCPVPTVPVCGAQPFPFPCGLNGCGC